MANVTYGMVDKAINALGNFFGGGVPDSVTAGIGNALGEGAGAVRSLLEDAGLSDAEAAAATDAVMAVVAL